MPRCWAAGSRHRRRVDGHRLRASGIPSRPACRSTASRRRRVIEPFADGRSACAGPLHDHRPRRSPSSGQPWPDPHRRGGKQVSARRQGSRIVINPKAVRSAPTPMPDAAAEPQTGRGARAGRTDSWLELNAWCWPASKRRPPPEMMAGVRDHRRPEMSVRCAPSTVDDRRRRRAAGTAGGFCTTWFNRTRGDALARWWPACRHVTTVAFAGAGRITSCDSCPGHTARRSPRRLRSTATARGAARSRPPPAATAPACRCRRR